MNVDEKFYAALSSLPCPVAQPPAGGSHDTYVTFMEADGEPTGYASNEARRVRHAVQVHIFTKEYGKMRSLQEQVHALLKAAGIKVQRWTLVENEKDTGYRHLAMTCEWVEKKEV